MNALVDAIARALEARSAKGAESQQYRSSLDNLERVFNAAVKQAMLEAFRSDELTRSSGPFREAVLTVIDPTKIRR